MRRPAPSISYEEKATFKAAPFTADQSINVTAPSGNGAPSRQRQRGQGSVLRVPSLVDQTAKQQAAHKPNGPTRMLRSWRSRSDMSTEGAECHDGTRQSWRRCCVWNWPKEVSIARADGAAWKAGGRAMEG